MYILFATSNSEQRPDTMSVIIGTKFHMKLYHKVCEHQFSCFCHSEICRIIDTRQVTRATHVRNRVCPRVELILKIIIILLIIFLGFIKSKPC